MIDILSLSEDKKINAKCLLMTIPISKYIELIQDNLENLPIQRKIIGQNRVYRRLIEDLKQGAIIPPISLILKENSEIENLIKDLSDISEIKEKINEEIRNGDISILDGLQRTYCIMSAADEQTNSALKASFLNTIIRAELWYKMNYTATLYKMVVLNTGQIKMSIRHQIESLNIPFREKINSIAQTKDIIMNFSTQKIPIETTNLYSYKLSDIVEAFTAFITQEPVVDKTNEVVKELERLNFIENHSDPAILSKEEEIQEFTDTLIALDKCIYEKYREPLTTVRERKEIKLQWTSRQEIIGSPAILSGIFAAFGKSFKNDKTKYTPRKAKLIEILSNAINDPLKL
jgi:hypothetical protein